MGPLTLPPEHEILIAAVASLAAYAWTKAKRLAGRADRGVDRAADALGDAVGDKIHELVTRTLPGDRALAQLERENTADLQAPVVSEATSTWLRCSLAQAATDDPQFAAELAALVAQLPADTPALAVTVTNSGAVRQVSKGGVNIANTGVVFGGIRHGGPAR